MTTPQDRINAYWTQRAPAYDAQVQRVDRFADDQEAWSAVCTRSPSRR